jgi:acetyl-CoA C-acetyltransferase
VASGIKDKVAIIGMGCSQFGERWEVGTPQLLAEAFDEALADAAIERREIGAVWYGSAYDWVNVGNSSIPASTALRLDGVSVTRVENMCATGTEALRGAAYAVASGAVDIALAIGAEKLKDTGFGGLPGAFKGTFNDLWMTQTSAPGAYSQLAIGYREKFGVTREDLKRAISHVSFKSHENGTRSPKAHFRKKVSMEQILGAPMIADPLGIFDCSGVSDGSAAAIVTTPDIARAMGREDHVSIKAIQLCNGTGVEASTNRWDGASIQMTRKAVKRAYAEAGIEEPRRQLSLMEVHDCFSITELVTMEDLFVSQEGRAVADVLDGFFDSGGALPVNIDGGLKCFGHPIAASGLRMIYEIYNQLRGRAGERQLSSPSLGLTHNFGGVPSLGIAAVTVLGLAR